MEIYEFNYGWDLIRARIRKSGSVYIDLPTRFGDRGSVFNESIVLEERGWRFTSTQDEDYEYYFHVWLTDDGRLSWANDMTRGIEYCREKFDPNCPNAGHLNDTALKLYTISQEVKEYQARNLPVHEVYDLRKRYLESVLKVLGYDSIEAVAEKLDDSKGVLGLNKVVDGLEDYRDLSMLVYSLGKAGDEDMIKCRVKKDSTREQILDYIKPVEDLVTEYEQFLEKRDKELVEKRGIVPGYKTKMKEKVGEYSWYEYEAKVKSVALLILELNADLLTEEQRDKLGIKPFEITNEISIKDRISNLIDNVGFNAACKVEDEFAYSESENLVRKIKELKLDGTAGEPEVTREEVVRILGAELQDLEERRKSVDVQETLRKKYYTKREKKKTVKTRDDEYVY